MTKATSSNLKAASTLVNCGCQCSRFAFSFILMLDMLSQKFQFPIFSGCKTFSSLTFLDSGGQVQGNCLTVDSTGARWCYTSHGSTCQVGAIKANYPLTIIPLSPRTWHHPLGSQPTLGLTRRAPPPRLDLTTVPTTLSLPPWWATTSGQTFLPSRPLNF